jgi:hypothetical protein
LQPEKILGHPNCDVSQTIFVSSREVIVQVAVFTLGIIFVSVITTLVPGLNPVPNPVPVMVKTVPPAVPPFVCDKEVTVGVRLFKKLNSKPPLKVLKNN